MAEPSPSCAPAQSTEDGIFPSSGARSDYWPSPSGTASCAQSDRPAIRLAAAPEEPRAPLAPEQKREESLPGVGPPLRSRSLNQNRNTGTARPVVQRGTDCRRRTAGRRGSKKGLVRQEFPKRMLKRKLWRGLITPSLPGRGGCPARKPGPTLIRAVPPGCCIVSICASRLGRKAAAAKRTAMASARYISTV